MRSATGFCVCFTSSSSLASCLLGCCGSAPCVDRGVSRKRILNTPKTPSVRIALTCPPWRTLLMLLIPKVGKPVYWTLVQCLLLFVNVLVLCLNLGRTYTFHCSKKKQAASK